MVFCQDGKTSQKTDLFQNFIKPAIKPVGIVFGISLAGFGVYKIYSNICQFFEERRQRQERREELRNKFQALLLKAIRVNTRGQCLEERAKIEQKLRKKLGFDKIELPEWVELSSFTKIRSLEDLRTLKDKIQEQDELPIWGRSSSIFFKGDPAVLQEWMQEECFYPKHVCLVSTKSEIPENFAWQMRYLFISGEATTLKKNAIHNCDNCEIFLSPKVTHFEQSCFNGNRNLGCYFPADLTNIPYGTFEFDELDLFPYVPEFCKLKTQEGSAWFHFEIDNKTLTLTQMDQEPEPTGKYLPLECFERLVIQTNDQDVEFVPNLPYFVQAKVVEVKGNYKKIPDLWLCRFKRNSGLEEVILPETIEEIGIQAFERCFKLTKINADNVKIVKIGAFAGCEALKIQLPNVRDIEDDAFNGVQEVNFGQAKIESLGLCALKLAHVPVLDLRSLQKGNTYAVVDSKIDELILPFCRPIFIQPQMGAGGRQQIKKLCVPSVIQISKDKYCKLSVEENEINVLPSNVSEFHKKSMLELDSEAMNRITKLNFQDDAFNYFWFLFPNIQEVVLKEGKAVSCQVLDNYGAKECITIPSKISYVANDFKNIWLFKSKILIPEVIEVLDAQNIPWCFSVYVEDETLQFAPVSQERVMLTEGKGLQNFDKKSFLNPNKYIEIDVKKIKNIEFLWNPDDHAHLYKENDYPVCLWICYLFPNLQNLVIDPQTKNCFGNIANHETLNQIQTRTDLNLDLSPTTVKFMEFKDKLLYLYNKEDQTWKIPSFWSHNKRRKKCKNLFEIKNFIRLKIERNRLDKAGYVFKKSIFEALRILFDRYADTTYICRAVNVDQYFETVFELEGYPEINPDTADYEEIENRLDQFDCQRILSNHQQVIETLESDDYKSLLMTLLSPNAPFFIQKFATNINDSGKVLALRCLAIAARMYYGLPWKDVLSGCCDGDAEIVQSLIYSLLPVFFANHVNLKGKETLWNALVQDDVNILQSIIQCLDPEGKKYKNDSVFCFQKGDMNFLHILTLAALFRSEKCFKYLMSNNFHKNLDEGQIATLLRCAVLGGHVEIIHIVDQTFPGKGDAQTLKKMALITLRKDLMDWIDLTFS